MFHMHNFTLYIAYTCLILFTYRHTQITHPNMLYVWDNIHVPINILRAKPCFRVKFRSAITLITNLREGTIID